MLSDAEKVTLRNRYQSWGLDTLKRDLKQPFRWVYGSPDRNQFAMEWVEEAEAREARRKVRRKRLSVFAVLAFVVLIGLTIGSGLPTPTVG